MSVGSDVLTFLAKLPPEAVPSFGRMLGALANGDAAKAEREARITAQTIAIKQATRRAARATAKALKR